MELVALKMMKFVTGGLRESDKMMKFEEQQRREERQFQLQMMRC